MNARSLLAICFALLVAAGAQETEFRCPMDPEVRSAVPGACPRCGMKLVRHATNAAEYRADMRTTGTRPVRLEFTVRDPRTNRLVRRFQPIHEKLFHLFVVSQDHQFCTHYES